jgi:hypothetical protein
MPLLRVDRIALHHTHGAVATPLPAGAVDIPLERISSISRTPLGVRRQHEPNEMAVASFNLLGQQGLFDDQQTVLSGIDWNALHWALLDQAAGFFVETIDQHTSSAIWYPALSIATITPNLPQGCTLHFSDGRAPQQVQEKSESIAGRFAAARSHHQASDRNAQPHLRATIFQTKGGMSVSWSPIRGPSSEQMAAIDAWEQLCRIPLPPPPAEEPKDLLAWEKQPRPIKHPRPKLRLVG